MPRAKKTKNKRRQPAKSKLTFGYPLVVFLMLCVGVFLTAWTFRVSATDILVTARIPAAPVTSPATIDSPLDQDRFSAIPIDVSGTCSSDAAYVEIFSNNVMKGSALCSSGLYQMSIDLFPDQNDLVAHSFNVTDDEGPLSTTVTVFYDVPIPPAPPPTPSNPPSQPNTYQNTQLPANIPPLTLKTAFVYKGFYVGDTVTWPIEISGGRGPYKISVNWGDGNVDSLNRDSEGQFDINHVYQKAGYEKGTFIIKVTASNARGSKAYIQFFVIVSDRHANPAGGTIFSKSPPTLSDNRGWLWIVWPSYVLVILLIFSFWLGEREELIILKKRRMLHR